jgi:AsmA protein
MLKWVFVAAGILALLLVAALAALPWFLNTPGFQAYVAQTAAHALGRPVKFASLSIAPFPLPTVKLRGLEVADDPAFGSSPLLTMSEGRIGIRLRPLLSGRVELADLTLEEPTIELVEDQQGRWNWASLGVPARARAARPRVEAVGEVRLGPCRCFPGSASSTAACSTGSSASRAPSSGSRRST